MVETILEVLLPWPPRALSPNGGHGHYMTKSRAKKGYRDSAYILALEARPLPVPLDAELRVALEFHPRCRRDRDQDNLVASMKSGLDGIAQALGIDDSRFRLDEPVQSVMHPDGKVRVRVYAKREVQATPFFAAENLMPTGGMP